jgi:hypothetical protein
MKSKHKKILLERHEEYENNVANLLDQFDIDYPDWRESKDADYIKKRIQQAARKMSQNRLKRKSKLVKKSDFKEWPFTSDSAVIMQTSKLWVSVIIKGCEYALNGLAASGLNIKLVHDAGKAIKGKSVGGFIKMGLAL